MRPSFEEINMRMALLLAERSTCKRLNVGCVITSTDFRKVLSMGYNGNASGLPNECDSEEPGKCGCIHAEQNAVINCDALRSTPKIIFSTNLPCPMCAKFMINLGHVEKVYYFHDYRIRTGVEILEQGGIVCERLTGDIVTAKEALVRGAVRGAVAAIAEFARWETTPMRVLRGAGITRVVAERAGANAFDIEVLDEGHWPEDEQ